MPKDSEIAERRARVRRSAIILGLVALAFYVGFIVMSVSRATTRTDSAGTLSTSPTICAMAVSEPCPMSTVEM